MFFCRLLPEKLPMSRKAIKKIRQLHEMVTYSINSPAQDFYLQSFWLSRERSPAELKKSGFF